MNRSILNIARTSLACPLGLYSQAAVAAMRAGISRFERFDELNVTISRLAALEPAASRGERMSALIRYAISETCQGMREFRLPCLPLFLALPEAGSGAAFDEQTLIAALTHELFSHMGLLLLLPSTGVTRRGRAGLFTALKSAARFLQQEDVPAALVGAVDSLVDPQTLFELAARGWLQGRANLDGRIPSEAAGFFLVEAPQRRSSSESLAQVVVVEEEQDSASFCGVQAGDAINSAQGLTRIFRQLRRTFPLRADGVFSAQPGEGFWGREFSYAYLRNVALMPEPLRMETVGADIGDAGAAAGAAALLRAITSMHPPKWSRHRALTSALVYGISDSGAIGACLIASDPA